MKEKNEQKKMAEEINFEKRSKYYLDSKGGKGTILLEFITGENWIFDEGIFLFECKIFFK